MFIRVSRVTNIQVLAVKVRFGEGLKSIWARLKEHPAVGEFVQDLDRKSFYFAAENGSFLNINPKDITDLELSTYIEFEFWQNGTWVRSPKLDRPIYRRVVLPIETVSLSEEMLIKAIKSKFSSVT
uniref:Uncharacterized protein n=1 Tax=candidate division CPR3 bacterium TaxID=2268181 RepID=A0A7V3N5M8_UNCC3